MPGSENKLARFIRAWHGSHADYDRFDDAYINTGEGAQVYGHGHYLGGVKATGETYMRQVTEKHYGQKRKVWRLDGEDAASVADWLTAGADTDLAPDLQALPRDSRRILASVLNRGPDSGAGSRTAHEKLADHIQRLDGDNKGTSIAFDPKIKQNKRDKEMLAKLQTLVIPKDVFDTAFHGRNSHDLVNHIIDNIRSGPARVEKPEEVDALVERHNMLNWIAANQRHLRFTPYDPEKSDHWARLKPIVDRLTLEDSHSAGRLYELRVNADPERMLDWDAALADSSQHVHDAVMKEHPSRPAVDAADTGARHYRAMVDKYGSPAAASKALYEAGIHGIKYKDQFSRGNIRPDIYLDGKKTDESGSGLAGMDKWFVQDAHIRGQYGIDSVAKLRRHYDLHTYDFDNEFGQGASEKSGMYHARATKWMDEHEHRLEIKANKPTYNYVIFDPNMIEHVRKYDLQGNLVHDYGVHAQPVDHDPFEGEHK